MNNKKPLQTGTHDETGHRARISRGIYVRPILFAIACLCLIPFDKEGGTGPILGTFSLLFIFPFFLAHCWVQRMSHRYTVSGKGLHISIGMWALLKKSNAFLAHQKIESVSVTQGLWGRAFGYGHLVITATGGSGTNLKYVDSPFEFAKYFED